ncbi:MULTISPECIES: hypothetical protein [unclassified Pseudomonas]|uniref:hypothetical protein n=1 Tax=unclassified Pseudomonas TaxID=196821 RepID=UPI002A36A49C|nr:MULTISPECIES: hypothetical protein [unclassified Pseudomonas]MDX9670031.1 hypothetical protein [Pseudomonas sp. P8_250]WPN35953.1 hypothetical protein QMK53_27815 [Pseudomonas sp. P8_139]WPN42244.1 hypothetical protein QMK55_03560 [Pseudomonas sp. P8_229]
MDALTVTPLTQFFKRNFKRVLDYWSQITVTLGLLGAGLAILGLYIYTRAIGRTDLFLPSIDAKSVLAIWLQLIVLIMIGYLVVLSASACFYGITVSMFDKVPKKHNRIASWLLLPLCSGFFTFTILLFIFPERFSAGISMLTVFLVTLLAYSALFLFKPFRKIFNQNTEKMLGWEKNFFRLLIGSIVGLAVLFASLPTLLILSTYVGEDNADAVMVVGLLCLGTLVLSLVPVFIFYISKGHVFARIAYGIATALVLFSAFLLLSPGAMPSITYAAAGNLAIRQMPARFILDESISLGDVDNREWRTRLNEKKKVEVTAFPLFAFGDILLLCSRDLLRLNLYDLPRYTGFCIATRNSKVTQKPLRPGLARALTWQQRAEHVVGWEHLRSAVLNPIHASSRALEFKRLSEQTAEPVKTVIPLSAN